MGHLPGLIQDLALILIAAAITSLLFRRLKQPLVLGYIIAGFLVGPHLSLTPTIADTKNIETLAQMGVIFLLFSLGLEFSFKKLIRVGGSASITAFVEIIFIIVAGFYLGRWMGWGRMDSLFLGGMLASSSTTITIKAFEELKNKNTTICPRRFWRVGGAGYRGSCVNGIAFYSSGFPRVPGFRNAFYGSQTDIFSNPLVYCRHIFTTQLVTMGKKIIG